MQDESNAIRRRILGSVQREERGHETACLIWTGSVDRDGYPERIRLGGRQRERPHRLAYALDVGPLVPGFEIDHLCNQRACCEATHLEQVTHAENVRRLYARARALAGAPPLTHCVNGHEFTAENTYSPPGRRERKCKECRREVNRRARRKATEVQYG